jgi:hypothetical protein
MEDTMEINWSVYLPVLQAALTLLLLLVAVWLKNDRDMVRTREYVARMIGDALAVVAAFAKQTAGSVSDAQLDDFSGGVYDFWVPMLPDGLPALVLRFYPKPVFQALFRKVWKEYVNRSAPLQRAVAAQ